MIAGCEPDSCTMRTHAMAHSTPRLLVSVLLVFLAGSSIHPSYAQQDEVRVAVIIANAAYPGAEAPLKEPINNARALADELRQRGFEVASNENLTKEGMREAIEPLYDKIKNDSTVAAFVLA